MNRLSTLLAIGFACLLASCGSSVSSSTQPAFNDFVSMVVSPQQFTLNSGEITPIAATVYLSHENGSPVPLTKQPPITFSSSDPRVSIAPAGPGGPALVCAGQWDPQYVTCSPTSTLPAGYVTITAYDADNSAAYDASNGLVGLSQVSVHQPVARITLGSPASLSPFDWTTASAPSGTCISQGKQVQYQAAAVDTTGNPIPSCSASLVPGCAYNNDFVWSTGDSNIAQVSSQGFVVAVNPGVTDVSATLNGNQSTLAFVTCPPTSIVLSTSVYTGTLPIAPFSTGDLALTVGDTEYVTAALIDTNNNTINTAPLTYITSDPLTGAFSSPGLLPLTTVLTAKTPGRFSMMASCEPPNCNAAVGADFTSPAGRATELATGFGYPIYSNLIGVTVQSESTSKVLVTGTNFDGTASDLLLIFDSESLESTSVVLPNPPNSLVVAPNGTTAYLGSSAGLMVVNLATDESATLTYPVLNGSTNPPEVVTGRVLGVSPDSRYVLLSDTSDSNPANHLVFLIDTTGTKVATSFSIPNITSVAFTPDDSNIWIGGASGVYVFRSDTFVATSANASTNVKALAWTPDGQSYFASGDQLINYSTCNDQNPQSQLLAGSATGPINLDTTAIGGVPYVMGLAGSQWLNYSVATTAQIGQVLAPTPEGSVCLSTVKVNPPVPTPSTLQCTANQVTFSPTLEQEFVTGVVDTYSPGFVAGVDTSCATPESVIHGYDVNTRTEILLPTTSPVVPLSGGVLNDGRKLYFGTFNGTNAAVLHRINLSAAAGAIGEDASVPVNLIPSFVAVVPK